jgi:hypothetical protein
MQIGASGSLQNLEFLYDPAGNLLTTKSGGATEAEQEFWYDGVHRLIRSVDHRASVGYGTIDYAYDNAGNMIRKGMDALRYAGKGLVNGKVALPDAVTSVWVNAYAAPSGDPTVEDPCPQYAGEEGTADTNGDGIPNVCQCGDANPSLPTSMRHLSHLKLL